MNQTTNKRFGKYKRVNMSQQAIANVTGLRDSQDNIKVGDGNNFQEHLLPPNSPRYQEGCCRRVGKNCCAMLCGGSHNYSSQNDLIDQYRKDLIATNNDFTDDGSLRDSSYSIATRAIFDFDETVVDGEPNDSPLDKDDL
mmetsp:Transcript_16093/g.11611  ORF Transcript_16093/g.11611 Transcript_16093/m.11611 type:complete len:140 (+) Transcript_16093:1774-2193(+)